MWSMDDAINDLTCLSLEIPSRVQFLEPSTSTKLKLGRNKFAERIMCNLQNRICFYKNERGQVNETIY